MNVHSTVRRAVLWGLALCGVLFLVVPATWAQDTTPEPTARAQAAVTTDAPPDLPIVPATPEHAKELAEWLKAAREWQEWDQRWRGVAQWTWSGGVAERRREPAAPAWMAKACDDFGEGRIIATSLLVDACELKQAIARTYDDMTAEAIARNRQSHQKQHEVVEKSSFFSKLHIDTPYVIAQSNGWGIFSIVGVHVTPFDIKKRMYIWLPPGVSLISIPNGDGRKLVPAYGAGVSIRWFDFQFPRASQPSTMYFNLSEFFIQDTSIPGVSNKLTMVGLSFTSKKPK